MRLLKRVAGIGVIALLLLSAGLAPVPGGQFPASAYAGGSVVTDPNPTAGDPDGPTGDVAPPTKGTITAPVSSEPPAKRLGAWAHWWLALKLWLRFTYVR